MPTSEALCGAFVARVDGRDYFCERPPHPPEVFHWATVPTGEQRALVERLPGDRVCPGATTQEGIF